MDGTNADDASDYRPGLRALRELAIRSPLKEAGLTKSEIRQLSKEMELPTWNRPAMACLASRIPYGSPITTEKLTRIARAESFLREIGFAQVRVRDHDTVARIEVNPEDIVKIQNADLSRRIVEALKSAGYSYVTLDLEGYRSGSLNEELESDG